MFTGVFSVPPGEVELTSFPALYTNRPESASLAKIDWGRRMIAWLSSDCPVTISSP